MQTWEAQRPERARCIECDAALAGICNAAEPRVGASTKLMRPSFISRKHSGSLPARMCCTGQGHRTVQGSCCLSVAGRVQMWWCCQAMRVSTLLAAVLRLTQHAAGHAVQQSCHRESSCSPLQRTHPLADAAGHMPACMRCLRSSDNKHRTPRLSLFMS